jgi:DNA invertase Pin-like site-specific DNA recombinase
VTEHTSYLPPEPRRWFGLTRPDSPGAEAIKDWVAEHADEDLVALRSDDAPGDMEHLGERRSIAAAWEANSAGACDGIILWRIDELADDIVLQELLLRETRARGLEIHIVEPPTAYPAERALVVETLEARAAYHRAGSKIRQAAGVARAKREGRYLRGPTPYGFRRSEDRRVVPDETEQWIIGQGMELHRCGTPLADIAAFFTAAGMKPRKKGVRNHARETVSGILKRAAERGIQPRRLSPLARQFAGPRALLLASGDA